jgi:phosphoribosyl 1,2-cyclic phosphate phosphodiesterase
MKIEFLGSGGAVTIPQPLCSCLVCEQARAHDVPYSRSGPSLFIHGPDILIDTPEEIKAQLNRAGIQNINACFYSHWHPDHVAGCRVWEMNFDFYHWPPQNKKTDIYLPQQVGQDFRTKSGTWKQLTYLEKKLRVVRLIELTDDDTVTLGELHIRPFRLAEDYVYAFMVKEGGKRVLIAPDELFGWQPPAEVQGVDLAILPLGLTEFNPLTETRHLLENHPILKYEATFRHTLEIIHNLKAAQVILTHIDEITRLGYDEFLILEEKLQSEGLNVTFAYDTLMIEV